MDNWTEILKRECKKDGQRRLAARLGLSPTTINQVINGTYKGDLIRVRKRAEGHLMNIKIDCPVIGEIPMDQCLKHQGRINKFAATNPLRVQLYKTCPTCPNRIGGNK